MVTNGLNAWVIVLSGELSMVRVADELVFEDPPPPEPLLPEPQAASPSARMPAAAAITNRLCSANLLMCFVFPVVMDGG